MMRTMTGSRGVGGASARATGLIACAVVFLGGCGGGDDRNDRIVVTDVDGVLHVQLPAVESIDAPEWQLRELYDTSPAGSDIELFWVVGARFVDGGTLAIAHGGSREILHLDAAGELRNTSGGTGDGPGEFNMMTAIDLDRSGNLIVYDPRNSRLTRLSPAGELLEITRMSSDNLVVDLNPLTEWADGRIPAVFGEVRVFSPGEMRDTVPLVVLDPSGARWDTLGIWPASEWAGFGFSQGVTRTEVGFGRRLASAGRGGRIAVGSTDTLHVIVYDETGGRSMEIAGWGAEVAVTPAVAERWRADLVEQRSQASDEIRSWLAEAPYRPTYPAFRDLLVDDRGRVWIGLFPGFGEPQRWLVIGTDGQAEGAFTIPDRSTLLDAAGDHVAVLRRTELGEEYIVVMEVAR